MRKALGLTVLLVCSAAVAAADVPELIKKLNAKDNEARRDAARQLAEAGQGAKPALKALTKALKDKDRFVRRYAAEAIGNIGPDAKGSIKELAPLVNDAHQNVRQAAVQALAKLGPAGVPALTRAMQGATSDVQEAAVKALGETGGDAVESLAGIIKDAKLDAAIRTQAVDAVVRMEAKTARKALGSLLDAAKGARGVGNVRQLRLGAITALGLLGTKEDKAVLAYLEGVAKDEKAKDNGLRTACRNAAKRIQSRK